MSDSKSAAGADELKNSVRQLKHRQMNCAVALTDSGAELLMAASGTSGALATELKKENPKVKGLAHGIATLAEDNPHEICLRLNTKPAAGIAKRLAKMLKVRKTELKSVVILVDDEEVDRASAEDGAEGGGASPTGAGWTAISGAGRPNAGGGGFLSRRGANGAQPADSASQGSGSDAAAQPSTAWKPAVVTGELRQRLKTSGGAIAATFADDPKGKGKAIELLNSAVHSLGEGDEASAEEEARELESLIAFAGEHGSASGESSSSSSSDEGSSSSRNGEGSSSGGGEGPSSGSGWTRAAVQSTNGKGGSRAIVFNTLGFARGEIKAAEDLLKGSPDGQKITSLVAEVGDKVKAQDYDGAGELVQQARSLAVRALAANRKHAGQQERYKEMNSVFGKVEKTYFTPVAAEIMVKSNRDAKPPLRDFVGAVANFQTNRTPQACDTIAGTAERYLQYHDNDLDKTAQGKNKVKRDNAAEALRGARHMKLALQMKQIGPPPWTDEAAMRVASIRAAFGFESGERPATPLGSDAGVSASFWVKGYDPGSSNEQNAATEFLFKPAAGEDAQPGFVKGGSAPREAVTKAVADRVTAMTGIDLGVPETSVASINSSAIDIKAFNDAKLAENERLGYTLDEGALPPTSGPMVGSLQQFVPTRGTLQSQPAGTMARVPAAECHRAAILDILTLNCDRHQGNFMVADGPDQGAGSTPALVPIDHGLTLPTREGLEQRGSTRMCSPKFNALLAMKGSYEPFSPDMVERLQMLDPAAIESGMKDSVAVVDRVHPDLGAGATIPDESARMVKRAAMFLKLASRQLSPAQIQLALSLKQAAIFDVDDNNFEQSAQSVIAAYAGRSAAMQEMYANRDYAAFGLALNKLGWHPWNSLFSEIQTANYMRWSSECPYDLVAAHDSSSRPPQGYQPPLK